MKNVNWRIRRLSKAIKRVQRIMNDTASRDAIAVKSRCSGYVADKC